MMKEKDIKFPSGDIILEGKLVIPDGRGPFPAVVVCHPHPLHGGSMDNNVVNALCQAITGLSMVSFKFNFRGVGGSQGIHSRGIGEREDVASAVSYVGDLAEIDSERIGLAGYSAGAEYAFPVGISDERVKALALVSPVVTMADFSALKDCLKPKLLVSGADDEIIPIGRFLQFCEELSEPRECHRIEGADHFWWGHEDVIAGRIAAFFAGIL